MKKALALTALIAAAAFGSAHAEDMDTANAKAGHVAIVYSKPKASGSDKYAVYLPTPARRAEAQTEIRTNDPLRDTLKDEGVELSNVVGISTAGDGSKIVYVR